MFWIEWELCSLDCFVELIPFFYVRVPSRQEVNGGKRKEAESQQGQKHLKPTYYQITGLQEIISESDKSKSGKP
ncbi:hypothetical protein COF64_14585 [Bacillus sp. AFS043905]|nr:hypothetical protein COF64_14585 [Bacillus sp. AFS043905]